MSQKIPITFDLHNKYHGKSSNNKSQYLLGIQQLYNLKNQLQMITNKLYDILNKQTQYKNKNKKFIESELNKFTETVSFTNKESDKILEQVESNNFKTNALREFNLFAARKIIMERILNLESYISTLPEPIENENNGFNFNNVEGPNYNSVYMREKSKSLHPAQKQQINPIINAAQTKSTIKAAQRKAAQKALTKSMRNLPPKNNTYLNNKEQTNQFINHALTRNNEQKFLRLLNEQEPVSRNNNDRDGDGDGDGDGDNHNYNNPMMFHTMNGPVRLSGQEAKNANNGIFPRNLAEEARQRELRHKKRQIKQEKAAARFPTIIYSNQFVPRNLAEEARQYKLRNEQNNLEMQKYKNLERQIEQEERQKRNNLRREIEQEIGVLFPRTKRTNQKPNIKHYNPTTDYKNYNESNNPTITTSRNKRRNKAKGKGSRYLDFEY
jgi:hypothetical protein